MLIKEAPVFENISWKNSFSSLSKGMPAWTPSPMSDPVTHWDDRTQLWDASCGTHSTMTTCQPQGWWDGCCWTSVSPGWEPGWMCREYTQNMQLLSTGGEHDCLIQCLRGRDMRCPGRGRDEPTWQHPTDPLASRIHGWGEKEAMRVLGRTGRFPPKSTCRGHQRMKWSSYNCTISQEEKQIKLLPADSQAGAASPSIKHETVEQSWKKTFLHS